MSMSTESLKNLFARVFEQDDGKYGIASYFSAIVLPNRVIVKEVTTACKMSENEPQSAEGVEGGISQHAWPSTTDSTSEASADIIYGRKLDIDDTSESGNPAYASRGVARSVNPDTSSEGQMLSCGSSQDGASNESGTRRASVHTEISRERRRSLRMNKLIGVGLFDRYISLPCL